MAKKITKPAFEKATKVVKTYISQEAKIKAQQGAKAAHKHGKAAAKFVSAKAKEVSVSLFNKLKSKLKK
tara:strand:+ start:21696 stop:21902 length:207 start_codon:yes stop_codon:yes gene_type:complete